MVERKTLNDICSKITDGSHFSPQSVEVGFYMPSVKDMTSKGFDYTSCKKISEEDYNSLIKSGCKPKRNDVLVAKDGSMLKYVFPISKEENIVVLSSIAILTPKTDLIDSRYLSFYLLRSDVKEQTIREFSSKGGVPRIILKNFKKIRIPIPSLSEQQRIVEQLDTFTSSIENLKEQIAQRRKQYECYRDQLLDLEGKEGVEMKTLGEICEFVRGPFGGALKKDIFVKDGYAIYEQQHAIYGSWSFRYYVDEKKFLEMKRFEVKSGDILMSCSGTMGKTSIVPPNCVKGIINQALLKLTAKECINNYFLKFFMDSQWFQDGLKKQTAGGAIQNVASVSVLKELIVPVPSLSEQQRIVSILDTFESSINNLEQQLAQREKQYEYYRNKLLTFE